MEDELIKKGIEFIPQQKIFVNDKLMTIFDFFVPKGNIALYCDGLCLIHGKKKTPEHFPGSGRFIRSVQPDRRW